MLTPPLTSTLARPLMRAPLLMAACLLAGLAAAPCARAQTPVPPFYLEAADCTAAFEARVVARLAQPKSEARDKAILSDTEWGFVFIGVAYKEGLRSPQAEELLKAAQKRWRLLGRPEQDARLATCTTRAQQLMDDVSFVERFLVRNRAKARVDRLLEREARK
ncbi:MAG: hypothetical protein QM742_14435 [Aquabacterium sp.]